MKRITLAGIADSLRHMRHEVKVAPAVAERARLAVDADARRQDVIADDVITAPAVVVGGGIAGLSTALALDGCVVAAGGAIGDGASWLAQGGIAAAIGPDDAPALHAADTLRVAADLAAADVAKIVTEAAPGRIAWLRELGVAFDRDPGGELALGREAGHGRHRIVHAGGDRTGAAVMRALAAAVRRRPDIRVLEGCSLVDIITTGARAAGVLARGRGRDAARRARATGGARNGRDRRLLRAHDQPGERPGRGPRRRGAPRRAARRSRVHAVPPDGARRRRAIPCRC